MFRKIRTLVWPSVDEAVTWHYIELHSYRATVMLASFVFLVLDLAVTISLYPGSGTAWYSFLAFVGAIPFGCALTMSFRMHLIMRHVQVAVDEYLRQLVDLNQTEAQEG